MKGIQWVGAGLGTAILIVFLLLPPLAPLTELGMKTVGVFLCTIFWWIFVDTAFSSALCIALLALAGVMNPTTLFATSMGSWLPIFIISCFGLTEAIRLSGFSRRFAMWFLTRPFATGHPWLLLALFFLAVTIMGALMSTAVTTILFMSIAVSILEGVGYQKGSRFAAMFIMGIAWSATASFVMTPIGHGSNLICMEWVFRDLGYTISFPGWMVVGIPMGLLTFLMLLVIFRYVIRPDMSKFGTMANEYIRKEADKIEPMKSEEKIALWVFFGVFVCWLLPSIMSRVLPGVSVYFEDLGVVIPPLVGTVLLCIIPVKKKPLLTFHQWMAGVEWGAVFLIAAVMAIGAVIVKPETGILELMTNVVQPVVTGAPFFVVVLVSVAWVVIQTNLMSNLVSAVTVYSIMMPAVIAAGVGHPVALGFSIFAGCHYAFSLPSATVATAIVAGSGWVPVRFMALYGAILIIPVIVLYTFVGYPFAAFVYR
ncbi:MAG: SLC13 family permease [Chloroflexota bacterium]